MEYTCIYKKETQMNVGEGDKVKKTCNDLAEKKGEGWLIEVRKGRIGKSDVERERERERERMHTS